MRHLLRTHSWAFGSVLLANCFGQPPMGQVTAESAIIVAQNSIIGVGLALTTSAGSYPTVTNVIVPSPAENAGISKGDQILSIDGKTALSVQLKDLTHQLRGEERTQVEVVFSHLGSSKTVLLTRQQLAPFGPEE